jgi:hypothetical protein
MVFNKSFDRLPVEAASVNHPDHRQEQSGLHRQQMIQAHPTQPKPKSRPPSPWVLFPDTMRWLNIGARTGHIAVTGILFGGLVLAVDFVRLGRWHLLTIVTGLILLALEWTHDSRWPHRGKGLLVLLHLGLCLLIHALPTLTVPLLWCILISGCIGSHMPRRYRHWSILQGWEVSDGKKTRL